MAIPYPSSPAVGDTFTYGGILYTWTGAAWISTFIRTPGTVGSVAVVAPVTNSGTPTAPVIGLDQNALLIGQSQVTNLVSDLAGKASTSDLTAGLALKANLAGGNALTGSQTITGTATGSVVATVTAVSGQNTDIFRITNSTPTTVFAVSQFGRTNISGSTFITPTGASEVVATVRGAASQSANLLEIQSSAGSILSRFSSSGQLVSDQQTYIGSGATSIGNTRLNVATGSSSVVGAVIRGATSQTADLLEIQNNSGTDLLSINASGGLVVGTTHLAGASPGLGQIRTSTDTGLNYVDTTANDSAGTGPGYTARRARGTLASPTQVQANDLLFGIFAQGYNNASGFSGNSAAVRMLANENFTTTGVGSSIVFETASDGTTGRLERMRVTGAGTVSVGTTSSLAQLGVITSSASTIPLLVRGVASQTADLLSAQNSAGSTLFSVASSGALFTNSTLFNTLQAYIYGAGDYGAALNVQTRAVANPGIIVRGRASQSANLQEWQNSGGTILSRVTSTGLGSFDVLNAPNGAFFGNIVAQPGNGAYLAVQGYAAGHRPFLVRGFGATTANLADYQNGSGTVIGGRNANAQIFTGGIAPLTTSTGGATTATSGDGTNATITTTSAHGLAIGDRVTVAGITPTGYNGTFSVASVPTTTTFTYANATTGSQTVAGTVVVDAQASVTARSAGTRGLIVRGVSGHAVNLLEVQDNSANILAAINGAGLISSVRQISVSQSNAGETMMFVRGAASQTGDSFAVRDSSANTIAGFSATGRIYSGVSGSGQTYLGGLTLGSGSVASQMGIVAGAATTVGAVIRGAASQTADLLQLQNSGGTVIASFTTSGSLNLAGTNASIILGGSAGTSGQVLTSNGAGSNPYWSTVSGGTFTGGTLTSNLTLAAGTTSLSPLTFQSGTNLTTVTAGANEYDGTVYYQTSNTNPGRALKTQNYYYVSSADWFPDFSSSNAVQSMLGAATRGITVAAGTTYEYELQAALQHDYATNPGIEGVFEMKSTTVSGSPTVSARHIIDYGSNTTNFTTPVTMVTLSTTGSVVVMPAISGGSRYGLMRVRGILRVTGTGTTKIYPGLSTSNVAGDNGWGVLAGLIFKMTPIGNGTVTSVGTWA